MRQTFLKVENLSKQYRLGLVGTGTLSHDLNRWWHKVRGKEDPYLKIGEVNDRSSKGESDYVWALKDINFEVKEGEVLGIIGKNGAGKSTLLKILSKVTGPTTGSIKAKGRIASLLEVGTGFHPELTGRENIFLNGAILGMTRTEIKSKLDEIIAFAGIERYVDTPVKRYSSGMYVRLAFAVAAHLEPEILIVDEVLAVGDAEFQKKAIGKMKSISKSGGRTVLFVSHDMTAINSLCNNCILLENGSISYQDTAEKVITRYLNVIGNNFQINYEDKPIGDDIVKFLSARLVNKSKKILDRIYIDQEFGIEYTYEVLVDGYDLMPNIHIYNAQGGAVLVSNTEDASKNQYTKGLHTSTLWIPPYLLNNTHYTLWIAMTSFISGMKIHFNVREKISFEVIENIEKRDSLYRGPYPGVVRPKLEWSTFKQ